MAVAGRLWHVPAHATEFERFGDSKTRISKGKTAKNDPKMRDFVAVATPGDCVACAGTCHRI